MQGRTYVVLLKSLTGNCFMIRSELVKLMADQNPTLSRNDVDRLVTAIFEAMARQLVAGGRVELRGFGAFWTRGRTARTGRNPRTGKAVDVLATNAVHFKPGKEMRDRLRVGKPATALGGNANAGDQSLYGATRG